MLSLKKVMQNPISVCYRFINQVLIDGPFLSLILGVNIRILRLKYVQKECIYVQTYNKVYIEDIILSYTV